MWIARPQWSASPICAAVAILLAVATFIVDVSTSFGFTPAVLYWFVVMLSSNVLERRGLLFVAAICGILVLVGFVANYGAGLERDPLVRCAISIAGIALTTFLTAENQNAISDLREQTELLQLTHDAIFVTDERGRIIYWNRGAEELYGWSAGDAIGQLTDQLLQTENPERGLEIRAELVRAQRWTGELRRKTKEGKPITVIGRLSLRRDERGSPVGIMETSNDISERKHAEDRMRDAERELRQAIDTIPGMVWSAAPDSSAVLYVNARWADLGWTRDDILGSNWRGLVHPDDLAKFESDWAHSRATGRPYEDIARIMHANGEYRWMFIRAAPLHDEHGKILRWYGVAGDMEDRRRAEEALLKAQSELSHMARITTMGELTASIAHEVNQPLAAVVTNGEAALRWLSREPPNHAAVKTSLEKMISNGRRASDVIRRLRAMARRSEPEYTTLPLNEVVKDSLLLVQREIGEHQVKLSLALQTDAPEIRGDRVQLQQVIINLVMNALQAMEGLEAGRRTLRIVTGRRQSIHGDTAFIEVVDSGVGIDAETAARLFTAFFSTKQNGMGMGLSICRSIVEAHHGEISAEPNEGPGATFCIRLPAILEVA